MEKLPSSFSRVGSSQVIAHTFNSVHIRLENLRERISNQEVFVSLVDEFGNVLIDNESRFTDGYGMFSIDIIPQNGGHIIFTCRFDGNDRSNPNVTNIDIPVSSIGVLLNVSAEDTEVYATSRIAVDIRDRIGNAVNGSVVLSFDDGTPDVSLELNGTTKRVEYVYDNANMSKDVAVTASFIPAENSGYDISNNVTSFNVALTKSYIAVENDVFKVHQEGYVLMTFYYYVLDTVSPIPNELLGVIITDELGNELLDSEVLTDSEGMVKVTFTPITDSKVFVNISYTDEKNRYKPTKIFFDSSVDPMKTTMDIGVEGAFINHTGTITVNLTDINGKAVTGGRIVLSFSDGIDSVEIPVDGNRTSYSAEFKNPDSVKDLTVTATFVPSVNSGYIGVNKNYNFIVDKIKTMISADNITVPYGEENYFEVSLKDIDGNPLSGLNLSAFVIDFEDYITDADGKILIPTKDLEAYTYYAYIAFAGNDVYEASSAISTIAVVNVKPDTFIDTVVTVTVTNISYGDVEVISFTLNDVNGNPLTGKINVTVGDKTEEANVTNGHGSIEIKNLSADTYPVVADFQGNKTHGASMATNYFVVSRNATKIIFENMNTTAVAPSDGKSGEWFYFTLKDANGRPLANTPMQIGFNGVIYTYEKDGICTDENGTAKLQINLGYRGDYTFAICYLGDENYNASFAVAKISVKEQTPSLNVPNRSYAATAKTKMLTATFKTEYGNPIADKWVTFTVNGKIYKAKTNANGIASVNVSITKKGTYAVVAKYAGDSTFNPVNKTAILKIS